MEIIRAKKSGFCFGVKSAIDITESTLINYNDVFVCGELIHNNFVNAELAKRGLKVIKTIEEAKSNDVVIVRSHGEPKEFYDYAYDNKIKIIDATCIFVKKIHDLVHNAYKNKKNIIIIGDKDHQEVKATNGWCNYTATILDSKESAIKFITNADRNSNFFIVCQTTIKKSLLHDILQLFDTENIKYEVNNTICKATADRQESASELAQKSDLMIVIGDKNSSNSKKLFEISQKYCKNTKFIDNVSDLSLKNIKKYNKIGVTAGASTPERIIEEVIAGMNENVDNNIEKNPMLDFMEDIENSLRLPKAGETVSGKVHQVMDDMVIVNIGCKKDGILMMSEVALEGGESLKDKFSEGDEIQAKVLKSDDAEGGILLSTKKLIVNENFKELEELVNTDNIINVYIARAVNGGVIANYKEISGFIPMSQLSDKYVDKADEFIGQSVDVKVIRVDSKKNRAVFSRKAVLVDAKRKQIEEIWENLNVGDIVEGKVMRFTDYGAFVDIGGIDGLLHISEISWGKLKHPEEALKLGEIINVKILSLNQDKGKISLGLKQTTVEPWSLVGTKYKLGDIITGKVVQIKEYGAFVELEAGLDGLVHISEIASKHVENVSDELKIGQDINAKIMEINTEKKRISLSIKAILAEDVDTEEIEVSSDEAIAPEENSDDVIEE